MNQRSLTWLSRAIVTTVVMSVMWLAHQTTQLESGGKTLVLAAQAPADAASVPLR